MEHLTKQAFLDKVFNYEKNKEWKFELSDNPEFRNPGFDDSSWRTLNLPHDWSIEQSYTTENTAASTGFLPGGIGWYRKSFTLAINSLMP